MNALQIDALRLTAESTLGGARAAAERLGLNGEAGAMPVLISALAMAVADAAGPNADRERLERGLNLACDQLADMVGPFWVLRTRNGASAPPHGED